MIFLLAGTKNLTYKEAHAAKEYQSKCYAMSGLPEKKWRQSSFMIEVCFVLVFIAIYFQYLTDQTVWTNQRDKNLQHLL